MASRSRNQDPNSTEASPLFSVPTEDDNANDSDKHAPPGNFFSDLTFGWFRVLLERGNMKQKLDQEDLKLLPLPADCSTEQVWDRFEECWNKELEKEHPSLFRALCFAYSHEFISAGILKFVHDCCVFVGPQVLHGMIVFLRSPNASVWEGLGLTFLVTLSQLTMSLCLRHYFFKCYSTGLRVRSAVVVAVYKKALVLSSGERQRRTLGQITNLMSIDAGRLQQLTTYLHAVWYSPLQIGLALYFLWKQLGASSLGGVLVILVMVPITKIVSRFMGNLQKGLMKAKDDRVEINGEVLTSMKVVKLQAWEESFQSRIHELRETELNKLLHYFVYNAFSRMLWTFTPLLVALATFAAYVWSGHVLDVASALTSLALFDILRFPLFMLPQVINNIVEAIVAVSRVQSFLLSAEHEPVGSGSLLKSGIRLQNLSAVYENNETLEGGKVSTSTRELEWQVAILRSQLSDAERHIREISGTEDVSETQDDELAGTRLCLRRIQFACFPGEMVAVVGAVGGGKSSLLNAILGEIRNVAGKASVRGTKSYFSQVPFIVNATVKENILFGHTDEPVDEELYRAAVSSCALTHDLQLFPHGDATEIGEKGVTLSGGQKARIALARAVYHRADLSLVDDALSAVDAHVAMHIFNNAITSELLRSSPTCNQRSVVLVTNAVQYLSHPRVNRIVVLQDGRIVESGSFSELVNNQSSVFSGFMGALGDQNSGTDITHSNQDVDQRQVANEGKVDASEHSEDGRFDKTKTKLMTVETRQTGRVEGGVYMTWIRAAGGVVAPLTILTMFGITESSTIASKWWITNWSENAESQTQQSFLAVYALINLVAGILVFLRALIVVWFGMIASRKLFTQMLSAVLFADMSFFDQTPVGRLVNRFSKDMYTVDEELMGTLRMYLQTLFQVISTIVVISGVLPVFLLCLVPMMWYYIKEQNFFTISYRELKRIDSVTRSPIFALLGETVNGVAVVRAFKAEGRLVRRLIYMLDSQQHAYYLTCAAQSWLAVRLELMGTLVVTFSALIAVFEHTFYDGNESFAGLAGLAISYALTITQSLNWSVRMSSDLEANMVAVERIDEYCKVKCEGSRSLASDDELADDWPPHGEIEFSEAKLRYRPELPLTLKGLNLRIPARSRVGVVGRTGAGKSTLLVALMRIVELDSGIIRIDGQDIARLGLAKLRGTIAVIPQDPVLFGGTIRSNLDPFDKFSDFALLNILERVGLYKTSAFSSTTSITSLAQRFVRSLNDRVSEGGSNFSVGQRQLLVIARALLLGAKIVVMDEATAAVDAETDRAIQTVIREEFSGATCIVVAHRINTIMDSDFILVMSDGKAKEFGPPTELLRRGGHFRDLVEASRIEE